MTIRIPPPIRDNDVLLPEHFTPIAFRPRGHSGRSDSPLRWLHTPDAILSIEEARAWHARGYLTMAQEYLPDRVLLKIKRRKGA